MQGLRGSVGEAEEQSIVEETLLRSVIDRGQPLNISQVFPSSSQHAGGSQDGDPLDVSPRPNIKLRMIPRQPPDFSAEIPPANSQHEHDVPQPRPSGDGQVKTEGDVADVMDTDADNTGSRKGKEKE